MEQTIRYHDGVGIITLVGRLDSDAAPLFDSWFAEQDQAECRGYVLDVGQVPYLTSAGLRSMLKIWKRMDARGGKLTFCGMTPPVQDLFKMAGFTQYLLLYNSVEEALAALA